MQISVIVPVYNGSGTLDALFRRCSETLGERYSWEIIFVYDCGKDESLSVIGRIEKADPSRVKKVVHGENRGQHNSILSGIAVSEGDFIVTIDEDLQHDPAYIPELYSEIKGGGKDVVYAKFRKLHHPGARIRLSELLRKVLTKIIPGLYPHYSPYRIIKRETAMKILDFGLKYAFIDGYLAAVTGSFGHIEADHRRRADGKSSYSYYKLIRHATLIALNYSSFSPLRKRIVKGGTD